LYCVAGTNVPGFCEYTTTDPDDPKIMCATQLTCDDCQARPGCTWCRSTSLDYASRCNATDNGCSSRHIAETNPCTDNCYTYQDCNTCQTNSCTWCSNSEYGLQRCMKTCATFGKQAPVSACASALPCSTNKNTCSACTGSGGCTYCEGLRRIDGSNPGRWCTNDANCHNVPQCGLSEPCLGYPKNASLCSVPSICSPFKECLSCSGAQVGQQCFWCDKQGTRYCDTSCDDNANAVLSCSVFGGTTSGEPTSSSGQTGSPATGSPGLPPVTPAPPGGSGTPGTPSPSTNPAGQPIPVPSNPGTPSPSTNPAGQPIPTTPSKSGSPSNQGRLGNGTVLLIILIGLYLV